MELLTFDFEPDTIIDSVLRCLAALPVPFLIGLFCERERNVVIIADVRQTYRVCSFKVGHTLIYSKVLCAYMYISKVLS